MIYNYKTKMSGSRITKNSHTHGHWDDCISTDQCPKNHAISKLVVWRSQTPATHIQNPLYRRVQWFLGWMINFYCAWKNKKVKKGALLIAWELGHLDHEPLVLKENLLTSSRLILLGGWTNPSQKYDRQIGLFPQGSGWKLKKNETTT